jgi:predicted small metal-binding protein
MSRVLVCECGVSVRGETDEELIDNALDHLRSLHPAIAENVTREQVLEMSEEE